MLSVVSWLRSCSSEFVTVTFPLCCHGVFELVLFFHKPAVFEKFPLNASALCWSIFSWPEGSHHGWCLWKKLWDSLLLSLPYALVLAHNFTHNFSFPLLFRWRQSLLNYVGSCWFVIIKEQGVLEISNVRDSEGLRAMCSMNGLNQETKGHCLDFHGFPCHCFNFCLLLGSATENLLFH